MSDKITGGTGTQELEAIPPAEAAREEQPGDLRLVRRQRERLGDQLYGQILQKIISGELKEGDKLPSEHRICQVFAVSRPTVREALMRLHADGLVTTRQGSGTFVRKRPSDKLAGLASVSDVAALLRCMEVRIALEGKAAALAAQRRTPDQMRRISSALAALRSSMENGTDPMQADFAFHRAVAEASGNTVFAELLDMLGAAIQGGMRIALGLTRAGSRERARRVVEEHETIAEAIERSDSEGADLAMRYHLNRARQRIVDGQRDT